MNIAGKAILVTGANRGIGQALVAEALRRGAGRVYAGTRRPLAHPDERVTPIPLDVTDPAQIRDAAGQIGSLDILISNAGIQPFDDLTDPAVIEQALDVNLFGTYRVIQGFLPMLTRSRGTIVNNLSLLALAPLPLIPAYSISKAAAFSMTQSLRGLQIPKASPESVAGAIFDAVGRGEEDIFPDPMTQSIAGSWRGGPAKALERQNAALLRPQPSTVRG